MHNLPRSTIKLKLLKISSLTLALTSFSAFSSYDHMMLNPHIQTINENLPPCEGIKCYLFQKDTAFVQSPLPLGQWRQLNAWIGYKAQQSENVLNTNTTIKDFRSDVKLIYGITSDSSMTNITFSKAQGNSLNIVFDKDENKYVKLSGIELVGGSNNFNPAIPSIATVAMYTGEAINNSLNIKNVDFDLTSGQSSSIYTAFIAKPSQSYWDEDIKDYVRLDGNVLNLENVSLHSDVDGDKHTTHLGAAFVNTISTDLWQGPEISIQMNQNAVNINNSDIQVGVIAATNTDSVNLNEDMITSYNRVNISNSRVEIGSLDQDTTFTSGIWATAASDFSSSNSLVIKNSDLFFGRANFSSIIAATFDASTVADFNYTALIDTNIKELGLGDTLSKINIYAGAANMSNNYTDKSRSASFNRIDILSSSKDKYSKFDTSDNVVVSITGGLALVTEGESLDEEKDISRADYNEVYIKNLIGNNVNITSGSIHVRDEDSGIGSAEGNIANIEHSSFKNLEVTGGFSHKGSSEYNYVSLYDVNVENKLVVVGGETMDYGFSNNNIVSLENSKVGTNSEIYGGLVFETGALNNINQAMGNSVIIGEHVTAFDGSIASFNKIYGGMLEAHKGEEEFYSKNSLYIASNIKTKELGGFQTFRFNLHKGMDLTKPLITVTDSSKPVTVVYDKEKGQNSIISITTTELILPERIILINAAGGFVTDPNDHDHNHNATPGDISHLLGKDAVLRQVQSLARISEHKIDESKLSLEIEDDLSLYRKANEKQINKQNLVLNFKDKEIIDSSSGINSATDPLMESSLASVATLLMSDDLLFDTLVKTKLNSLDGGFATTRAGFYSIDTNNRIDLDAFNALIGYGFVIDKDQVGIFLETGHSNYDTYTFDSLGSKAYGHGNTNYIGAGAFINKSLSFDESLYLSSYLKLGSLRNDFKTTIEGALVDFDKTSSYVGGHLGITKNVFINEGMNARSFISYFYDYVDGNIYNQAENNTIAGASFTYNRVSSHKLKTGMLFDIMYGNFIPFAGVSCDYVLNAKATGYADDSLGRLDLNSSNLNGASAVLDLGFKYVKDNMELASSLAGSLGNINATQAQVQAKFTF